MLGSFVGAFVGALVAAALNVLAPGLGSVLTAAIAGMVGGAIGGAISGGAKGALWGGIFGFAGGLAFGGMNAFLKEGLGMTDDIARSSVLIGIGASITLARSGWKGMLQFGAGLAGGMAGRKVGAAVAGRNSISSDWRFKQQDLDIKAYTNALTVDAQSKVPYRPWRVLGTFAANESDVVSDANNDWRLFGGFRGAGAIGIGAGAGGGGYVQFAENGIVLGSYSQTEAIVGYDVSAGFEFGFIKGSLASQAYNFNVPLPFLSISLIMDKSFSIIGFSVGNNFLSSIGASSSTSTGVESPAINFGTMEIY